MLTPVSNRLSAISPKLPLQSDSNHVSDYIRGFPKVDHSSIDVRIVLEPNKFNKKSYLSQDLNVRP